jgi:hypothetical protein
VISGTIDSLKFLSLDETNGVINIDTENNIILGSMEVVKSCNAFGATFRQPSQDLVSWF